MYTDSHCHLHEFSDEEIEGFRGILIAAVSDDLESSRRTIELADRFSNVVPLVGIHPWSVRDSSESDLEELEKLVGSAAGVGEIGLDKRYHTDVLEKQREFFVKQLRMAREYSKPVNLHCLDAWRECLDLVLRADVPKAVFHWYNGPLDLVEEISGHGFYISLNSAIKIQEKHKRVARVVPLNSMLIESDGPYNYRGLRLTPRMIPETLMIVGSIRGVSPRSLEEQVYKNFLSVFGPAGVRKR